MQERTTDEISGRTANRMDRHAFAQEYQRIYRRLWLLAVGIVGDPCAADDIVQQSALVAFDRLAEFREGSNFAAWLSEIVKRTAWNVRRKAVRRKTFATDPLDFEQQIELHAVGSGCRAVDLSPDPEPRSTTNLTAMEAEIDDDLFRVLREMSEDARCCLLLRVVDGLSYADISQMLGIPEGTAASHVHRGKSFARQRLMAISADTSTGKRGTR